MQNKFNVMIVEDHPINLKLVNVLLESYGFNVMCCSDAETALTKLVNKVPDMIIMDIGLPGMDGLELTQLIKSNMLFRHIKIVALTAFAMKSDKDKVFEAGCDGYITKPIDTRNFEEQIMRFLK